MRCHGGKTKVGKQIAKVLLQILNDKSDLRSYIEPFCGMCGVLYRFCDICPGDISISASDKNDSIIQMWRSFQSGWDPETTCSNEKFTFLKSKTTSSPEKGFYGHAMTFGGLYFQCYQESLEKSLPSVSKKCSTMAQAMKHVEFSSGEYTLFTETRNALIFCDPPYSKHNRYYDEENKRMIFDTNAFWEWCVHMSRYNVVVVNELLDEEVVQKTRAHVTLEKIRKCKYSTKFNQDVECLYIIDNRTDNVSFVQVCR